MAELNQQNLDLSSAYGDGWYDGFLDAQSRFLKDEDLSQYSQSDVLEMSEDSESDSVNTGRSRWFSTPPKKQGTYWHWSGNKEDAPLVLYVLYSGASKKCFVSRGQLGIEKAINCDVYGGFWAHCISPKLPLEAE